MRDDWWLITDDRQRIHFEYCRQKDSGLVIMLPSIRPIFLHFSRRVLCLSWDIYPHAKALSSQCCVSACSASESVNLLTKWATYLLFCHASAIFPPIERDDRLIWSTSEYSSSLGNSFVTSKISCCSSKASWYTFKSRKLSILSAICHPSSVLCPLLSPLSSSFVHRPSSLVLPPSSIFLRPSSLFLRLFAPYSLILNSSIFLRPNTWYPK